MPRWGILRTSPLAVQLTLPKEDRRNTTPLVPGSLIENNQPKQRGNITTHTQSWELEWGQYSITKGMIWKISGSEPGLGYGAPPGMYVG